MFLYAALILPEALTPERRKELMEANEATQESHHTPHNHSGDQSGNNAEGGEDSNEEEEEDSRYDTFMKRMNFFKKLAILLPSRDSETGKRDYRLLVLAVAFTIYRIAGLYTNDVRTATRLRQSAAC